MVICSVTGAEVTSPNHLGGGGGGDSADDQMIIDPVFFNLLHYSAKYNFASILGTL